MSHSRISQFLKLYNPDIFALPDTMSDRQDFVEILIEALTTRQWF